MIPADTTRPSWELRAVERSLGTTAQRQAARARALVGAARSLAIERGSTEFTVGEVAALAGVSLRTFYRHFPGKDDLLVALFEEEARRGARILAEAMDGLETPEAKLERYVIGLWTLLSAGSGYALMLVREHLRLAERRADEMREALGPLVGLLRRTLDDGAETGEIRPIGTNEAVLMFSTVLAHVHTVILFAPTDDPIDAAHALWGLWKPALTPANRRSQGVRP